MVLYNHSTNLVVNYTFGSEYMTEIVATFIQRVSKDSLTRVNRPLFFTIAACLFFWTLEPHAKAFFKKFKRRFVSLTIPYVICLVLSMLVVAVCTHLPVLKTFITRYAITNYSPLDLLHNLIRDPLFYQMWFIRNLMIWVLCSPLIYIFVSRLGWWSVPLSLGFWLSDFVMPVEKAGLCFFCIGAVIGVKKPALEKFKIPQPTLWLLLWLALACLHIVLDINENIWAERVQKAGMLVGFVAVWCNYDRLPERFRRWLQNWVPFTFFIYLFHEPLLTASKKFFFYVVPLNPYTSLGLFMIMPLLVMPVLIAVGRRFKQWNEKIYYIVTGGR